MVTRFNSSTKLPITINNISKYRIFSIGLYSDNMSGPGFGVKWIWDNTIRFIGHAQSYTGIAQGYMILRISGDSVIECEVIFDSTDIEFFVELRGLTLL